MGCPHPPIIFLLIGSWEYYVRFYFIIGDDGEVFKVKKSLQSRRLKKDRERDKKSKKSGEEEKSEDEKPNNITRVITSDDVLVVSRTSLKNKMVMIELLGHNLDHCWFFLISRLYYRVFFFL